MIIIIVLAVIVTFAACYWLFIYANFKETDILEGQIQALKKRIDFLYDYAIITLNDTHDFLREIQPILDELRQPILNPLCKEENTPDVELEFRPPYNGSYISTDRGGDDIELNDLAELKQ